MRLDKFLSNKGIGSRNQVKKFIRNSLVSVDGLIVDKSDFKVSTNSIIKYDGLIVDTNTFYYIMLNKPMGVLSATKDTKTTVIDILNLKFKDLFPVGRLDRDTVGLLLITNNGHLAHNMLSPKKHVSKTYFVKVIGLVTYEHIKLFKEGLILDSFTCKPSKLKILRTYPNTKVKNNFYFDVKLDVPITELEIEIVEGKYHQIKKMVKAIGCYTLFLKRISFGPLVLDLNLKEGEHRYLCENELNLLKPYM